MNWCRARDWLFVLIAVCAIAAVAFVLVEGNPRVIGDVQICDDGMVTSATGRGACSWHGGVED